MRPEDRKEDLVGVNGGGGDDRRGGGSSNKGRRFN